MKEVKIFAESESDTRKIFVPQQKIAELERILVQKQLLIDFKAKMVELTDQEYTINIKKIREKAIILRMLYNKKLGYLSQIVREILTDLPYFELSGRVL